MALIYWTVSLETAICVFEWGSMTGGCGGLGAGVLYDVEHCCDGLWRIGKLDWQYFQVVSAACRADKLPACWANDRDTIEQGYIFFK